MIEDAIELVKYGMALVPVHYPILVGTTVLCSCNRGAKCTSIAKHPISQKWQEIGEKNVDAVKAWTKAYKADVNFGVITGQKSGVVVLDIDPRHDGEASLDAIQTKYGKLPDTAMVITGSGGSHYYFKAPMDYTKNGTNIAGYTGIDYRGDGGFVVAPGSRHASGGTYDWEASSHPEQSGFADLPDWLHKLIYKPPTTRTEIAPDSPKQIIQEGGRNVWLASVGGALRNKGLGYKPIMAALWYANLDHCTPPLTQDEVRLIAKSISKYTNNGMGNIL